MNQRIIPAGAKYESKVYVIDEDKLIYKLYCRCPNFSGAYTPKKTIKVICGDGRLCDDCVEKKYVKEHGGQIEPCKKEFSYIIPSKFYPGRRKKSIGEYADIKHISEPCKHLKPAVERLIKMGYILKKPKEMTGDDTLKPKLKAQLMERALGCCEGKKLNEEGVYGKCGDTNLLQVHRKVRGSNGGKYNMDNCEVLCWGCHRGPHGAHSNEFRGCQGK